MAKSSVMELRRITRKIAPSERLVCTELWDEDWTGGEALGTMVFAEHAGKTTLTRTVLYSSRVVATPSSERPWSRARSKATTGLRAVAVDRMMLRSYTVSREPRMTTGTRKAGEVCWINMLTPQPAQARVFFSRPARLDVRRDTGHGPQGAGWRAPRSAASSMSRVRMLRRGRPRTLASW